MKGFFYACVGTLFALTTFASAEEADPLANARTQKGLLSITKLLPGLTPVSDYTGDNIWERSTLSGDWGGERQRLYEGGFAFDMGMTQVLQWLASGGEETGTVRYNGLLDYGISLDTGKLGWWSGGLLGANAQTSWGAPIKGEVGVVSPVNYTALVPVPFQNDTVLMEYYLTQGLPNNMLLTVGRVNLANYADKNRFANDPRNQFLNTSLGNDPLFGYFFKFSTYVASLGAQLTEDLAVAATVFDPETGPGDYGGVWEHVGASALVDYKWEPANGLGGTANVIFMYTNKETNALDNPAFAPGLLTPGEVPMKSGNWGVFLDFEQYLWKPDKPAGATSHVRTRSFDYQERGVGFFFRFGYTPEDRNPWNTMISGGVGARGVIPGRPYDRMGIGAYSMIVSDDLQAQIDFINPLKTEVGVEAYYNFAITPWLQLSADVQWIAPAKASADDAVVLGTRLFTQF